VLPVPVSVRARLAVALVVLLCTAPSCDAGANEPGAAAPAATADRDTPAVARDTVLEAALGHAASDLAGTAGIAVLHLQRGVAASLNGDQRFPLASVYKLPVAYAALMGGHLRPGDSVVVQATDLAPGATPFGAGVPAAVEDLVRQSLAHSDNTASDVLLRLAGGPAGVMGRLAAIDAGDIRVDRSMRRIFAAWRGIRDVEGIDGWGPGELGVRGSAVPREAQAEAQAAFVEDARDAGSAEGLTALLAALYRGDGLSAEAHRMLLSALEDAATGPGRIRAGVPAGTTVAHKTGTLGPLTHDAGIIDLPDGRGQAALAVLMRSDAPVADRERVIAAAARAVWQRFTADPAD
jgi:beta-lactamase class A